MPIENSCKLHIFTKDRRVKGEGEGFGLSAHSSLCVLFSQKCEMDTYVVADFNLRSVGQSEVHLMKEIVRGRSTLNYWQSITITGSLN